MLSVPNVKQIKLINKNIYLIVLIKNIIVHFNKNKTIKIEIICKQQNHQYNFYISLKKLNKLFNLDNNINNTEKLKNKLILIENRNNKFNIKGFVYDFNDQVVNI